MTSFSVAYIAVRPADSLHLFSCSLQKDYVSINFMFNFVSMSLGTVFFVNQFGLDCCRNSLTVFVHMPLPNGIRHCLVEAV